MEKSIDNQRITSPRSVSGWAVCALAASLMLAGCAKELNVEPAQYVDPDIARAREFVETQVGNMQADNSPTRGVNKNHPAIDAFEADWSRAKIWKIKDKN